MRIGELAARTGTTPRMLRSYEERGLLRAARSANGYRDFGEDQVAVVDTITELVAAGLPLDLVSPLLLATSGASGVDPEHLDPEVVARMEDHWARLCRCAECIAVRRDALGAYLDSVRQTSDR